MDRRFLLMFMPAALSLVSCLNDPTPPPVDGEGVPAVISLNPFANDTTAPATRADYHDPGELTPGGGFANGRDPEDMAISHLRVLLYKSGTSHYVTGYECDVALNAQSVEIKVVTGKYDVLFIANTDHNGKGTPGDRLLNNFFANPANYRFLVGIQDALLDAVAFDADQNIPMIGIARNVSIMGNHKIVIQGSNGTDIPTPATPESPWTPSIERAGIRLSTEITMSTGQMEDWTAATNTAARKIKISNLPPSSYLNRGGFNGASTTGRTERVYTAVQTTLSNGKPVIPPSALTNRDGGYYWLDESGTEDVWRVRFDRIILPELVFADANTAGKALELSLDLGGMAGPLKAKLSLGPDPGASREGYTLPRNTWLHLNATVAENKLRVFPEARPWNTAIQGDDNTVLNGNAWLKVSGNPATIGGNGRGVFSASTNHSSNTITAAKRSDTPTWLNAVSIEGITTTGGVTSATVAVDCDRNITGAVRSGYIDVSTGTGANKLTIKVEVFQRPAIAYAAPGMIGYIAEGPRKGELTLRGSKEYRDTPVVDPATGLALATGQPLETETVHAAYFKWGSLVATSSESKDVSTATTWFDADDIIAAPVEMGGVAAVRSLLTGANATNAGAWGEVPFRGGAAGSGANDWIRAWDPDPVNGLGDPCQYWFGDDWHMPSGGAAGWYSEASGGAPFGAGEGTWATSTTGAQWKNPGDNNLPVSGAVGGNGSGAARWDIFLPAVSGRLLGDGNIENAAYSPRAIYWSNTFSNVDLGYNISIIERSRAEQASVNQISATDRGNVSWGMPIRCVETPGTRVPAGVIGYVHAPGRPEHHTLTLEGDKSFYSTGEAEQNQYTVYAAYFKFGSLVALDSSNNGHFTHNDVVAVPKELTGGDGTYEGAFAKLRSDMLAATTAANKWATIPVGTANVPSTEPDGANGLGDPCAYWFGSRYGGTGQIAGGYRGGKWRLPTVYDNINLVGRPDVVAGVGNDHWLAPYFSYQDGIGTLHEGTSPGLRLPAKGGLRDNVTGSLVIPDEVNYWSSTSPGGVSGFKLMLKESGAVPNKDVSSSVGNLVRCVRDPWGGYDDILYFEGTGDNTTLRVGKWGSDVSSINNMALFKFGGVVGFTTGGTHLSAFNAAAHVKFNPTGTTITGYGWSENGSNNTLPNVPAFSGTDYAQNIRNVSTSEYHNAANLAAGKGDPCKLAGLSVAHARRLAEAGRLHEYDSGWRLPTAPEQVNFIGGATDSSVHAQRWLTWKIGYGAYTYQNGTDDHSGTRWPFWGAGTPGTGSFPVAGNAYSQARSQVLPAVGAIRDSNAAYAPNTVGYYWSSTPYDNLRGYNTDIDSVAMKSVADDPYSTGMTVRCVRDDQNPAHPAFRGHP